MSLGTHTCHLGHKRVPKKNINIYSENKQGHKHVTWDINMSLGTQTRP